MADRIAKVAGYLKKHGLDALLVTNYYNILYLTGLKTLSPHEREAYLLVTRKDSFVFTDGRYVEQFRMAKQLQLRTLTASAHILAQLQELTEKQKLATIGFEREDLKWSEHEVLHDNLPARLVPVDRLALNLRSIKSSEEVNHIARACKIGDECLEYIAGLIKPGVTEKQLAWEMEKWVRERGYGFSFEPIVAVDGNAAIPHYNTREGEGKVGAHSLILIDMGIAYKDYCSDITRMFSVGQPAPHLAKAYQTLRTAQETTLKRLAVLENIQEADRLCRGQIDAEGYPAYAHSTGHGVGLEVHEYPKVSSSSQDVKKTGQVFTVEPGIYMAGKWGMRIEDTVTVTEEGIGVLTRYPKDLTLV